MEDEGQCKHMIGNGYDTHNQGRLQGSQINGQDHISF